MSCGDESTAKKIKIDIKSPCPYGRKCYRKNPQHLKDFMHPKFELKDSESSGDESPITAPIQINTTKLSPCPFGAKCYRKNLLHFAEFSHPVSSDGASTSKVVPDDSDDGSDTDVYDSSEEQNEKNPNVTKLIKKESLLAKRYSLMSEDERKELIQKALEMKKQLQEELAESKKEVEEKENEIKNMQSQINKGVLMLDGERKALEGDEIKYFNLMAERSYKEGSAAQTHFRLAESQFYRLLSGSPTTYQVKQVEYVVNPALVKKFNLARKTMKKDRGEEYSHPILAFHGTEASSIAPIVETGFRIPGVDDTKLQHRMKNEGLYGKGIYFSEFTHYSLGYVAGANKILLNLVLPGKIYQPEGMLLGQPLKAGFDSHMSPCKKELVMFHSDRILPCYIVHYSAAGGEFKYKKPVDERRKVDGKDAMMRLYWKAHKRVKTTIFRGYNFSFCGEFAFSLEDVEFLVIKHGGTCNYTDPAKPKPEVTGRGKRRGRPRTTTLFMGGAVTPSVHFHYLVTNDDKFNQQPQPPLLAFAAGNKSSIVREEFLYDCIVQKKLLESADYEFD